MLCFPVSLEMRQPRCGEEQRLSRPSSDLCPSLLDSLRGHGK